MKKLAVIPSDPISAYLSAGYGEKWLREYFNPLKFFDEVYVFSPKEKNNPDLLGLKAIHTQPHELPARLKEFKIDVVRAYGGFWPCAMACCNKVNGIPVVVSVHDTSQDLLRDAIAKADVVLSMSKAVRNLVLTKFKREDRAWLLPNRIHFDYMRPYTKVEIGDELDKKYPFKYKIIHVGRKVKQKNLDNLIKSLRHLGKDYCLLAVGKGDSKPYEQIACNEGVLDQCFFIEAIRNEDLPRYFSWADCMCMPSRWEGFSIVIIEALAAEAVFVGSNIPEIAEAVQHGHNGLLVNDHEDPQAIAEMIKIACTDPDVRKKVRSNARKSVEHFEQSKVDALEVEYYKKSLEMAARGDFRLSMIDQLTATSCGKGIRDAMPVRLRKSILSFLKK